MSCIRLYTFNYADRDETALSGTNIDAQFPANNIKDIRATKVCRSISGTNELQIIFDLKTIEEIDTIGLAPNPIDGWGFTGDATFEASPVLDFTSPSFTTTVTPNQKFQVALKTLPLGQSYRFWRVTVSNTGSFAEIGKVLLSKSFSLANNNIDFGWTFEDLDRSKKTYNRYGQPFIDITNTEKRITASFRALTTEEFESLIDELNFVGTSFPFWVNIDEDELVINDKERFIGRFYLNATPKVTNQFYRLFNLRLDLREAL